MPPFVLPFNSIDNDGMDISSPTRNNFPPSSTSSVPPNASPSSSKVESPHITTSIPKSTSSAAASTSTSTSSTENQSNRSRLPPMTLTDLPSPFALPTPTNRDMRDGILGNQMNNIDPVASTSTSTTQQPSSGPKHAYRQQQQQTPGTPMDNNTRSDYTGDSPSVSSGGRLRMISPRVVSGGNGINGSNSNPWLHLAATSGIPTPAVEGSSPFIFSLFAGSSSGLVGDSGGGQSSRGGGGAISSVSTTPHGTTPTTTTTNTTPQFNRYTVNPISRGHSPHLGGPFERLNLSGGGGQVTSGSDLKTTSPHVPPIGSTSTSDPFSYVPTPSRTGSTSALSSLNPKNQKEKIVGLQRPTTPSSNSGGSSIKLNFPAGVIAARQSSNAFSATTGSSKTSGATTPTTSSSPTESSTPAASGGSGSTASSSVTDVVITPAPMSPSQLIAMRSKVGVPPPLILDLRPPSSFTRARLPSSISVPIPSTLLKRRTFTMQRLTLMLPERDMRLLTDFSSRTDVIVIDQDSVNAPMGGVLAGLASKIAAAANPGWEGKIWFLKGGINACRDMEMSEGSSEEEDEGETEIQPPLTLDVDMDMDGGGSASGRSGGKSGPSGASGVSSVTARSSGGPSKGASGEDRSTYSISSSTRMAGGLGKLAFLQASTKGSSQRKLNVVHAKLQSTPDSTGEVIEAPANIDGERSSKGSRNGSGGEGTHVTRSSGSKENLPQISEVKQYQPANPFFDNIRQNLELSHGGITERIPLNLPESVVARSKELPLFLREMVEKPEDQVAEQLAGEFEAVERGEQRRLQGIMNWHSRGSRKLSGWSDQAEENAEDEIMFSANAGIEQQAINRAAFDRRHSGQSDPAPSPANEKPHNVHDPRVPDSIASGEEYFPFSISAGIERGAKNRYKNIWPFDYSRVRLNEKCHDDGSDYINANFVQPRGTSRRYIATQGPMDATYRDFWTLVWEQNVQVIVMLTKQFEGGAIKCGDYWTEGEYGPYKLTLVSSEGGVDEAEKSVSGFNFFNVNDPPPKDSPTIKRMFLLTNRDHPEVTSHKITQIQCVSWPDFDVPSSPHTLLSLVKDVDAAVAASAEEASAANQQPPVLVHCSAGVGRTGSFIIVDAVLDALRREHLMKARKIRPPHRSSEQSIHSHKSRTGESSKEPTSPKSRSPGNGNPTLLPASATTNVPFTSPDQMELDEPVMDNRVNEGKFGLYRDRVGSGDVSEAGDARTTSTGPASPAVDEKPSDQMITHSDAFEFEMGRMPTVVDSKTTPSPITDMPEPVKNVLENMRIQRMSLCQSLRQYAFVYRSVIYGYLDMLDEETQAAEEAQAAHDDLHDAVRGNSSSSAGGVHFDEDGHIKRRASPTELSGASLTKRASFRQSSRTSGSGAATPLPDST